MNSFCCSSLNFLLLAEHHGTQDRGKGRLVGQTGGQDGMKPLLRRVTESLVARRRFTRRARGPR